MWQRRRRRGQRGRLPKSFRLGINPTATSFTPSPPSNLDSIIIEMAELEAFRLVDLEGLSQDEAGERMGVSRGTIWRLVQSARKKTALALIEGRTINISTVTR